MTSMTLLGLLETMRRQRLPSDINPNSRAHNATGLDAARIADEQ